MQLSPDQEKAIHQIKEWLESGDQTLTMGGYAGTGKTTIISYMLKHWSKMDIAVCAFTGKAASVLRGKGVHHAITMHKLIYTPVNWCRFCRMETDTEKLPPEEEGGKPERICKRCKQSQYLSMKFVRVPFINVDLVIVDEASMLSADLVLDLESLAKKILYVGDHGQLEPVGDDPGIMMDPTIRLEQIHRQAAGSPIIQFAHYLRTSNMPRGWEGGKEATVHKRERASSSQLMEADVVLCGFNNTRVMVNKAIRKARGFRDSLPEPGERIICLQNDTELGIFNGLLVTVENRRTPKYGYTKYDLVDDVGEKYLDMRVYQERFNQEKNKERFNKGVGLFDFGYALTVHKSQGSEWNHVAVLEQIASSWTASRWRYTAATRAAKRLDYWISR
jgi:ATP-dependent exoDNAse (exonuclease V) alpha subunit